MDRVEALIHRLSPEPICDDCIVERLEFGTAHRASHRTRELTGKSGYQTDKRECALCGETKQAIRRISTK